MTTEVMTLYRTTVGKKMVMAVTGLLLLAFVLVHMVGNLQVLSGAERINAYAKFLKATPSLLWGTRITMLVALLLHVFTAAQLTLASWAGRPVGYRMKRAVEAGWTSRTMRWTGPIVLAYLVYHLLHLTVGTVHLPFDADDVYRNVVVGFSICCVAVIYMAVMVGLGLHLGHGFWSAFQTLGLSTPRYHSVLRVASTLVAVVIAAGFIVVPLTILVGLVD